MVLASLDVLLVQSAVGCLVAILDFFDYIFSELLKRYGVTLLRCTICTICSRLPCTHFSVLWLYKHVWSKKNRQTLFASDGFV